MLGIFNWLRRQAAQAVLDGVADACDAIAAPTAEDTATVRIALPESLARRLTPALPDGGETEAAAKNGRRK